ncbi:MAG: hypothetical protein WAW86_08695 [Gammaproteobacteria bacterium]
MSLLIANTDLVLWQDLVKKAEESCHIDLEKDLEAYLVSLLIHYMDKPELVKQLFAKTFLQALDLETHARDFALREIGDKCLIYSGLFPKSVYKKQVTISYFVHLGQSSYANVSNVSKAATDIYQLLASQFVSLMDILQSIRLQPDMLPLEAYEQWTEVGSKRALRILQTYTKGAPAKRN